MNSPEENSEDFCLDFVQELGLCRNTPKNDESWRLGGGELMVGDGTVTESEHLQLTVSLQKPAAPSNRNRYLQTSQNNEDENIK